MKAVRHVLAVLMMFAVACPLWAAEGKKAGAKKPPKCPAAERMERMLEGLTLTAEQKAKLEPIGKEFGPKLTEAIAKQDALLTPEQKKARAEAGKAAREAGKKGKEMMEAIDAALKLPDDQKAKFNDARKAVGELDKALRAKVIEVLTPEQQQKFKPAKPAKPPKQR